MRPSGATWKPDRTQARRADRAPATRSAGAGARREPEDFTPRKAAPLRVVRGAKRPAPGGSGADQARPQEGPPGRSRPGSERRKARGPGPKAVREEFLRLGGPRGTKFYEQLVRAAEALAVGPGEGRAAAPPPVAQPRCPQSATVRELMGVALYRSGRYDQAAEELESYVALCGAVDQHPALMDCYRALKQWKRVETLWDELGQTARGARGRRRGPDRARRQPGRPGPDQGGGRRCSRGAART